MQRIYYYLSALLLFLYCISSLAAQNGRVDRSKLNKVLHFSDSTGANQAMLIHRNEVIGYLQTSNCDSTYMNTASMVKSWTGLAIGVLVKKGLIESEQDKICKYLPEWESGCKNGVTIEHLLTMSSGLQKIRPATESILAQDDMNAFALEQAVTVETGTKFSYSNEGVQLLGILIEKVSGQNAEAFFRQHIFNPLGMDSTSLYQDVAGNHMVFGGAKTTLQDAAQIGLLVLNKGKYEGQQVVSNEWIQKSTTPSEAAKYYGFLWWIDPAPQHPQMENFAAMGDGGQMTIIFPHKDLIYLRQQSCKHEYIPNMSWMGPEFIQKVGAVIE